jgi:hypothetical protein
VVTAADGGQHEVRLERRGVGLAREPGGRPVLSPGAEQGRHRRAVRGGGPQLGGELRGRAAVEPLGGAAGGRVLRLDVVEVLEVPEPVEAP